MSIKTLPPPRNFWKLIFAIAFLFLLFPACNKIDLVKDVKNLSESSKDFFYAPSNTQPIVLRVMQEIKNRNAKSEFVNEFGKKNGFPVWDKAIITLNKTNNNFAAQSADTIIYIPITSTTANRVNGYIFASINDSLRLSYSLAKDYTAYPSAKDNSDVNADKFALRIMTLENIVNAKNSFDIMSNRLFRSSTLDDSLYKVKINITPENTQSFSSGFVCWDVCVTQTCNICFGSDPNCPLLPHGSSTSCSTSCVLASDDGQGDQPPSGGGSGGGGGGNEIPHYYPCVSTIDDPCPIPPDEGPGWVPSDDDIVPCDPIIKGLETNTTFINEFKGMTINPPEDREICKTPTDLNNSSTYNETPGIPGELGMDFPQTPGQKCVLHRHYFQLNDMFSTDDFWNYMIYLTAGIPNSPSEYFWGVVGPNGIPYLLKVKDLSKISVYLNNPLHTFAKLHRQNKDEVNFPSSGDGLRATRNEVGFLNMLKNEGLADAFDLYLGNTNFNSWTKLATDSRTVREVNCQ